MELEPSKPGAADKLGLAVIPSWGHRYALMSAFKGHGRSFLIRNKCSLGRGYSCAGQETGLLDVG